MATPASVFDNNIEKWLDEGTKPWRKLYYKLVHSNLSSHLSNRHLYVLDAGGGNGVDTMILARKGHRVALVDYSTEMLAEAQRIVNAEEMRDQVELYPSELSELNTLFSESVFDLALCHNVIQYEDDARPVLAKIANATKHGGLISIISTNRYALPLLDAFTRNDLEAAIKSIDQHEATAVLFGTSMKQYSAEQTIQLLRELNCDVLAHYGLGSVYYYWGTNEIKSNPDVFAQLEQLEFALTDRHPYRLMARFFQVICRKK